MLAFFSLILDAYGSFPALSPEKRGIAARHWGGWGAWINAHGNLKNIAFYACPVSIEIMQGFRRFSILAMLTLHNT